MLVINRNQADRDKFKVLLDKQDLFYNSFSSIRKQKEGDYSIFMSAIQEYKELLHSDFDYSLDYIKSIKDNFFPLVHYTKRFYEITTLNSDDPGYIDLNVIVAYFEGKEIGFIFLWGEEESYAVQFIQNIIPYFIVNTKIESKKPFVAYLFDYIYSIIQQRGGKYLCVKPIYKMIQFVERNGFIKYEKDNLPDPSIMDIYSKCEELYKYHFRPKSNVNANPYSGSSNYLYIKILEDSDESSREAGGSAGRGGGRKIRKTRKTVLKGLRPLKYYRGLTRKAQAQRAKEIKRFGAKDTSDPSAYVGFKTDVGVKTKPSSYTQSWNKMFPEAKSLEERAKVTGVPKRFLQKSFDRGMAAWRTGHRPGASQQAWGYARVSSFLLCGKTYYSTDSDLAREASRASASARRWFTRCAT